MAINLTTRVTSYVDEVFTSESKKSLLTNDDFDWTGAHTIKINKVNTVGMNDYDRNGTSGKSSRYGDLEELGNEMGFDVWEMSPFIIHDDVVSSSLIRTLIVSGQVEKCEMYMGRNYAVWQR